MIIILLLQKELMEFNLSSTDYISARLKEENLFEWEASIQGPPGTPYEGGTFTLDLSFPADYPFNHQRLLLRPKYTIAILTAMVMLV